MRTQHSASEVGILLAGGGCISDSGGRGSSVPSPGSESDCSPALGLAGGVKAVQGVMSHYWSLESLHSTNGKPPSPLNLDTELHFELDVHVSGRCHGMVTFSFCKVFLTALVHCIAVFQCMWWHCLQPFMVKRRYLKELLSLCKCKHMVLLAFLHLACSSNRSLYCLYAIYICIQYRISLKTG